MGFWKRTVGVGLLAWIPSFEVAACDEMYPPGLDVVLLDAGSEPRQLLRMQLVSGEPQDARLEMAVSMAQTIDGNTIESVPLPLFIYDMTVRVGERDEAGPSWVHFEYHDVDAQPMLGTPESVLASTREALRGLSGFSGRFLLNECLFADYPVFESPDGLNAGVQAQISDLEATVGFFSDPLPSQPVGVGARWEVRWNRVENSTVYQDSGIALEQSTTYTIESIEGSIVTLSSLTQQSAQGDVIAPPELGDVQARLISLESTGTGRIQWDLQSAVPISAQTELMTEQVIAVDRDLGEQIQTHQIYVRSTLNPTAKSDAE